MRTQYALLPLILKMFFTRERSENKLHIKRFLCSSSHVIGCCERCVFSVMVWVRLPPPQPVDKLQGLLRVPGHQRSPKDTIAHP